LLRFLLFNISYSATKLQVFLEKRYLPDRDLSLYTDDITYQLRALAPITSLRCHGLGDESFHHPHGFAGNGKAFRYEKEQYIKSADFIHQSFYDCFLLRKLFYLGQGARFYTEGVRAYEANRYLREGRHRQVDDGVKLVGSTEPDGVQGYAGRLRPEIGLDDAPDGRKAYPDCS
jgi:hypothetical protein